ncbi:MAG: chromosome segregation protein SMC [Deltaproteobacteria bacterium]|nr:chromosome segregation protein SMC [Deltaproteobacteria bacterium]
MRIKRVEIIGFKSFCDRAVVNIGESITGVVGPNGCGKSNIVDAIRWCMGEQSAKHLRGKAMEDVIFAGSESRGPAPMAEVSLTFDDVGFSHETLEMARHSDEAETERALDGITPEDAEAAPVAEAAPAHASGPQGVWTDAEGNPIPTPQDEVAKVLGDEPPAFDFARYTEVTITRRLYRDGTSQYFINKTPCRLRDITDFFLGTGVGTKAYAIIEQGRIGQIVSSRPQDRRLIIEEAAGITKFKAKKKAAEKKLDQTRQNLMRVSDIVSELDKRMGTLRRQAQKAERYRKYKSELKDIELWKATHRWLELAAEGKLVSTRLGEVKTGLEDTRAAWTVKDAHVVAERGDLAVEERRLIGVQEHLYELDNKLRLGESKIGFERREADELDTRIATAREEIDEIAAQRERGQAELTARETELSGLASEVDRESAEVAAREAAASEARQQLVNVQGQLDEARAELGSRRTEIATSDTQLEALARRKDEAQRRFERVMTETEQHTGRVKELDREGRKVNEALATLRQTRLDLGSQNEHFASRQELLSDEVQRGEAEVETLRTELHRRRSRLTSLQEIQERYEGFQRGTRAVMQGASDIAPDAIRGVVADVVRAPEQLEIAVEAALGDRLGGVLVSEPEVGLQAIGYLKAGGGGRSAFVPIETKSAVPQPVPPTASSPARFDDMDVGELASSVPTRFEDTGSGSTRFEGEGGASSWMSPAWDEAPRGKIEVEDRTQLVSASLAAPVAGEGVLGRMAEMVTFADGYESVGKRLLGRTVVVDQLERALELHAQGVKDRLVTLDGDLVDEDGVVAGGSREAQGAGVLAQKREIRDLEEIVGKLEHDLSEAMARLVTAKTELKQVQKALEGLRTQVHEGDIAIMGHEKDESRVRTELERHRERLGQLGNEQLELEHRLRAIELDETTARDRKQHAIDRMAELERIQLDHISAVASFRERLEDLQAALTEARIRAAQLGEKRAAAEAATLRLQTTDAELATRAARLAHEIEDATARATSLREGCDALAAELADIRTQRETQLAELDAGRTAYDARLSALTEVELAARELRTTADRLATERGQLELRAGQIAMHRGNVEDATYERYQTDVTSILYDYHQRPHVTETDEARLTELKDLLERMGSDINLTAIEEFAEVSQRFEFLSAQKIDLERAVDQLQRAIDKINKTSRKLFKDTFTAVNNTFKQVYPRLFRGGQAYLSLSGGENVDLLEAGVEIMAQPPGKKNSTVEQLSGGEKALTAVALVFSIFLIKPSPFCILDEVDAPLDEANVDRYNEIVREMTDRSQFIVITHNKRTMEAADTLYGVTMQEPGVSKLVSVNLAKLGAKTPPPTKPHDTAVA